jgi:hypothetical protein
MRECVSRRHIPLVFASGLFDKEQRGAACSLKTLAERLVPRLSAPMSIHASRSCAADRKDWA